MYYNYHARIRQRIDNGEYIGFRYANLPRIGPCAVLYFETYPHTRPVRPEKYSLYPDALDEAYRLNKQS